MPNKITLDDMRDLARRLRWRARSISNILDENKVVMIEASGMLDALSAQMEAEAKRPDPLGEALNMGDGSYRP